MTNPHPPLVKATRFESCAACLIDVYEKVKPRRWQSDLYRALQIPADWHFAQAAYMGVKGTDTLVECPTEEEETEQLLSLLFKGTKVPLDGALVLTGMQMHLSRLDRALKLGYSGNNVLKQAATRAYLMRIAQEMGLRARELIVAKLVSEPPRPVGI